MSCLWKEDRPSRAKASVTERISTMIQFTKSLYEVSHGASVDCAEPRPASSETGAKNAAAIAKFCAEGETILQQWQLIKGNHKKGAWTKELLEEFVDITNQWLGAADSLNVDILRKRTVVVTCEDKLLSIAAESERAPPQKAPNESA